jgi:hypothetical protein
VYMWYILLSERVDGYVEVISRRAVVSLGLLSLLLRVSVVGFYVPYNCGSLLRFFRCV